MELKSFLLFVCTAIVTSASSIGSPISCETLTTYKQHATEKSLELHNLDAAIVKAIDAGEPLPEEILAPYKKVDGDDRHAARQKAYDALQQLQDAFQITDTTEYGEHGQESLEQLEIQLHSLYGELEHQSLHEEGHTELSEPPSADDTVDLDAFRSVVRAMCEFVDGVDELLAAVMEEKCSAARLKARGALVVISTVVEVAGSAVGGVTDLL